jgi:4-amino-4-deoxy-L-arabinose transferase-like glycosyltransferase
MEVVAGDYRCSRNNVKDYALLFLVFGIAFFQCLGRFPLMGTDEARYMEIPREMLERGDFITPTLNYVPYFEKPPLHYWLNALSTVLFGATPFAARFFSAFWGLLCVLMVYHLGAKLFGRSKGFLSACILGTSIGFVTQCRVNITDTTLTFFLCAALGSFLVACQEEETRSGLYYHLFYLFAALAVLVKGLIGIVLPCAIIFWFLLLSRRWGLLREMRLQTGIPLFLLVCAPWFILVARENPGFLNFFFIHEHFQRFLTKVHNRYQPPWFYLPVLLGCMLPWSFFIPSALIEAWRRRKGGQGEIHLFLLLWVAVIFLFFSVSHSKLVPYILPVYPAVALLIGHYLGDLLAAPQGLRREGFALSAFHLVCAAGIAAYPMIARKPAITTAGAIIVATLFAAQGVAAYLNTASAQQKRLLYGIAVISYLTALVAPPVFLEGIAKRKVTRDLALMVKAKAGREAVVASLGYHQELPLYTQRRVLVVGSEGELEFGSKQGDQRSWFIPVEQFQTLWGGMRQVFAVVPMDALDTLVKGLKPTPAVLGIQGPGALITNRQ